MATMVPVMVPASRRHDNRDRDVDDLRRTAEVDVDDFTARTHVTDGAFGQLSSPSQGTTAGGSTGVRLAGQPARLAVAVASRRAGVARAAPLVA
jgi:hypothetical protein